MGNFCLTGNHAFEISPNQIITLADQKDIPTLIEYTKSD